MSYGYDIQKLVVCDDVLWGFGNNIAARMPMKFDAETIEWDDAEKTPTISDGSVSDGSISENVPALIYEEDYVRLTKDITFSEDYTLRGKKSINDVPDKIRDEVKQVLIDEGHPELAEGGN